jgi:4-aminobutyrate aminotransferase-like enzyme
MATARIPDSALVEGGRGAWLARHGSGRPDEGTVLTRARGSLVWDFEGRECIDCTSQAQSKNLGANDPRVMDGAIKQLREIAPIRPVCSSLRYLRCRQGSARSPRLGSDRSRTHCTVVRRLTALKFARRSRPEAENVLVLQDASHGRSLATMAASWPHPPNPSGRSSPTSRRCQPRTRTGPALGWTPTPTLSSGWSCCATRSARASTAPPLPCSRSPRLDQAAIATALPGA